METYWVPGVNRLGSFGRWAFVEFTDVYAMQSDFEAELATHFDRMNRERCVSRRSRCGVNESPQRSLSGPGERMVEQAPSGSETLALLRVHKPELAERFGVIELALFGSAGRGESGPDSDVDILVSFNRPTDPDCFFGVQFYIEDLLGRPVDLVTDQALRPELRPYIEAEAVRV